MAFFIITALLLIALAIGVVYGRVLTAAGRELQDEGRLRRGRLATTGTVVVFAVLFVGFILIRSLHSVENGHVGLVRQFGDIVGTKDPGMVMIAPWQSLSDLSIRIQSETFIMDEERVRGTGSAASIDSQAVYATVTLNYQVDPRRAVQLYKETGGHYREILIKPRVPQTFKAVTASYKAVNILAFREQIRRTTQQRLDSQLARDGIHVTDFLIENIHFTPDFQNALEGTQVAAQRAKQERERVQIEIQKARQKVERAKGDANAIRERAKGQAEANRRIAASLTNEVIAFQAVQKLPQGIKTIVVPTGSSFLLPAGLFGQAPKGG
jgi:regulator of protease activity HflC (stomatin/prohibitin superfamily)